MTADFLRALEKKRESIRSLTESWLLECRSENRALNDGEQVRLRAAKADIEDLDERIEHCKLEIERARIPDHLARIGRGGREVSSAGRLAPLGYSDEQLRRAFEQVGRGENAVLETRDFSPLDGLVPPDLGPVLPVFPRHDTRLLNRLPGVSIDVPAIAYLEVDATTGSAGIVTEGAPKPELVMAAEQKTATARKIAAHVGVSWEAYSGDYPAFVTAVQSELMATVVDAENQQLYGGAGEASGKVRGTATAEGALTLDASTISSDPGPWDALEKGIELLRSGPALANPDLVLLHPTTWSAIRRVTDNYGRYYVAADPSTSEVNTAWGIPVVVSTQFDVGKAVLVDTTLYGRVVVRESLVTRIGYSGSDFTDDIIRFVSEERLTQTIERPKAICVISNMPTALEATTTTSKRTSK